MMLTIELTKKDIEEALMEKATEISGALPHSMFKGAKPVMDKEFLTLPGRVRFTLSTPPVEKVEGVEG